MMKFPVAVLIALFGVTSAFAADLPARTYTKAPVYVDPGYNWTGFYIGGNVGYSWGRSSDTSTLTNGPGATLFTSGGSTNLDGVVGGGQIGYNWQVQSWVWGFEADIQGTDEKGSRGFTCGIATCTPPVGGFLALVIPGPAVPATLNQKIDWFGTVRARVGVLATPRVLFYATGGLAYGEVNSSETIGGSSFSASDTRVGYAVGGGIEGAIGGNWTAKLEYLYVDLGNVSNTFVGVGPIPTVTTRSHVTDNIVRVGLNYRFGGPVVARY
jgi:outer membrane immunogenic protein